jgi:hypothetical protein
MAEYDTSFVIIGKETKTGHAIKAERLNVYGM